MLMKEFEDKAYKFLQENGYEKNPMQDTFVVNIFSIYKSKRLLFESVCFKFEMVAPTLDELFDNAYKVLVSFGPKVKKEDNLEVNLTDTKVSLKLVEKGEK